MSTAIVTAEHAAYSEEQRRLITDVLCKGASPVEVEFFMEVAKRCRLDPFRRQIHAVKRWDSKLKREALTFQVGIDGLRAIAARTGEYAGNDDAVFERGPDWYPIKATVTVYRMVHGQRIPFTASVHWDEYVQTTKEGGVTSMWRQRPFGQLGKCAEAAALRKAFPEESGGLYTEEELRDEMPAPATTGAQAPMPVSAEVTVRETVVEAELPAPDPEAARLTEFLDQIAVCQTGGELTVCRNLRKERFADKPASSITGRAIQARATELGVTWCEESQTFEEA